MSISVEIQKIYNNYLCVYIYIYIFQLKSRINLF